MLKHLWSETVKGRSSSSWVAAYLGSTTSLSTSEKKSNNPLIALRRKDVFSSSHRSLRSRSYRQWSFARTLSPRTLSICWLCLGSAILGACACIRACSSLLSMLGSHRDQWEACVAAWRFVHCLAIVEGGKTADARGSSSSPSRPSKALKCVRRGNVLSVSLRFHGYCAWKKTVIARASIV